MVSALLAIQALGSLLTAFLSKISQNTLPLGAGMNGYNKNVLRSSEIAVAISELGPR
jgi:hypothetical protein